MALQQSINGGLRELALFAGAGGGILGGKLLGWRTVCAVEYEPHAVAILTKRQNEGLLEPFPIWDDVRTFEGKPWRGIVDVVSGGFPCQDISSAGKGKGLAGSRSGLWSEMARIIGEVRPAFAFVENSPMLVSRGLTTVLGDFAEMGYDARWCVLGADDIGAPHQRKRCWIVAHTNSERQLVREDDPREGFRELLEIFPPQNTACGQNEKVINKGWLAEPDLDRVVDGMADGLDRIARCGNGQVPAVVASAWEILTEQRTT